MIRLRKKSFIYILALILTILQLVFYKNSPLPKALSSPTDILSPTTTIIPYEKQKAKVVRVIDGDTIEIEGKVKVRYIGVNTPELHDPKKPIECFGQAATDENKRLVEGKEVYMQRDVSDTDKYKRLLRYVWVGDVFVNDTLSARVLLKYQPSRQTSNTFFNFWGLKLRHETIVEVCGKNVL